MSKVHPEAYHGRILLLGNGFRPNREIVKNLKLLQDLGWEFVSAGDISICLKDAGIKTLSVGAPKDCPRKLNNRLVPNSKVLSAILARHEDIGDMEAIENCGIKPFNIILVNISRLDAFPHNSRIPDVCDIDPFIFSALICAVKNGRWVNVITSLKNHADPDSPTDLEIVTAEIVFLGKTLDDTKAKLAKKALNTLWQEVKLFSDMDTYKARTIREKKLIGSPT
jgi:AICAR transformylase/IMP cyclohydrolase PurH